MSDRLSQITAVAWTQLCFSAAWASVNGAGDIQTQPTVRKREKKSMESSQMLGKLSPTFALGTVTVV